LAIFSCTPPPVGDEIENGFLKKLIAPKTFNRLQAGGSVEISIDGQYYSGSADVRSWGDTLFKIDVFSVFGAPVLNLEYNSKGAFVTFQDSSFFIEKSGCMGVLPFRWAKLVTVDQFMHLLQSNFDILAIFMNTAPQKTEDRRFSNLIWRDSLSSLQQIIHKRTGSTVSLIIKPRMNESSAIRISEFSNYFAHEYKFVDDNRNYFSIHYDKMKLFNDQ
jgi:hypothetical protein